MGLWRILEIEIKKNDINLFGLITFSLFKQSEHETSVEINSLVEYKQLDKY